MRIGVPKEIKTHEYRVGISPAGVHALVAGGAKVVVEKGAGLSSGFSDEMYVAAGGTVVGTAADVWQSDMVVKVKEPLPAEFAFFREGLTLYTYLHLAAFPELTRELLAKKVNGVAYETITDDHGSLPLLRPMSEIAGRMAAQVGASCLQRENGGKGLLLGGIPGTRRGQVVILGGGIVGTAAARIAIGLGGRVTVLDVNAERMLYLEDVFGNSIETLYSNPENVMREVTQADLVIGAVLLPGGAAPRLVTREHLRAMEPGSVIVDVAVDQGGCIETCRATTHDKPTFVEEGVVHYCVANMPGAVPRTSTIALTNATLPYALMIARDGLLPAAKRSRHLANGINTLGGACVYEAVAKAHGLPYTPLPQVL
ncbi:MAG TPA: alanine dehydrogenase [Nannocystaceae bacterium]|nr:alanine dehydrogenase [Nannocystaceae bacterium]